MGWKSTYEISRKLAIEILKNNLDKVSNEHLANMLEGFEEPSFLRNYCIQDQPDLGREIYYIGSVEEFFNPS